MTSEFVLKALGFGVLGLCAIMLVATWRIVLAEQHRKGEPRRGIIRLSYVFMSFCLALAILNAWVQLHSPDHELQTQLQEERAKLDRVRSAAQPLLNVRGDVIGQLPDDLPQKATLTRLLSELRVILQ